MTSENKIRHVRIGTCVVLLFACFYMYDFYKCLSGFIANGFREPLVMLPMILVFFLPVFCFLFFFYDWFVRAVHPVVRTVYSALVIAYAVAELALILANIRLYMSNNALGVYDALPSILLHFPYDMILVLVGLLAWQIVRLAVGDRKGTRLGEKLERAKQRGMVHVALLEYVALCVLAIVVFVFVGAAITATFAAFENAFYDLRYLFLLLWVGLVPIANLLLLVIKPEKLTCGKRTKVALLGAGVGMNVLFGLLFLVLELTYPDFLVHIGKPLFLITFSVSLPIEPAIILGIMVIGTALLTPRLIRTARGKRDVA